MERRGHKQSITQIKCIQYVDLLVYFLCLQQIERNEILIFVSFSKEIILYMFMLHKILNFKQFVFQCMIANEATFSVKKKKEKICVYIQCLG